VHELGMCQAVVDAVERRAGDRPVSRVRVRVGSLQHVHPEAFAQSFAMAASGTVAEGAEAELVLVPAVGHCGDCDRSFETKDVAVVCPECGSTDVTQSGGDDLVLELLEYRSTEDVAH